MDYKVRVLRHYQETARIQYELLKMLYTLCPDGWSVTVAPQEQEIADGIYRYSYDVSISDGNDTIFSNGKTIGSATAHLIYTLLDGAIFPLAHGGGENPDESCKRTK